MREAHELSDDDLLGNIHELSDEWIRRGLNPDALYWRTKEFDWDDLNTWSPRQLRNYIIMMDKKKENNNGSNI